MTPRQRKIQVIKDGSKPKVGWKACTFGRTGKEDISVDPIVLDSYFLSGWEVIISECFLVAAAVEFCDRSYKRPEQGWARDFALLVPVNNLERWCSPQVQRPLEETLAFLTGDRWVFEFYEDSNLEFSPKQATFAFRGGGEPTLAFSDGMDSRMVAGLASTDQKVIRVHLGGTVSKEDSKGIPFVNVPYSVKVAGTNSESSGRSRGFKHCLLSGLAAYLVGSNRAILPESGQGCLAPALITTGHAYPDYRSYPVFAEKLAVFLKGILGVSINFEYPRIWFTKGETLASFTSGGGNGWQETRSCWQGSRHSSVGGSRKQCGICAACLLRRMSVYSAGFCEEENVYLWANLMAPSFEAGVNPEFAGEVGPHREYGIAGVHLWRNLARLSRAKSFPATVKRLEFEFSRSMALASRDIGDRFERLLVKHEQEWDTFIEHLGKQSFLREWV